MATYINFQTKQVFCANTLSVKEDEKWESKGFILVFLYNVTKYCVTNGFSFLDRNARLKLEKKLFKD